LVSLIGYNKAYHHYNDCKKKKYKNTQDRKNIRGDSINTEILATVISCTF